MKQILDFIKKYSYLFLVIGIILSFIIPKILYNNKIRNLYLKGEKSIAYVYDRHGSRSSVSSSKYYFYIGGEKIENICNTPSNYYSKDKFYIVLYMPDNPKNSTLDFNHEIIPELVNKHFPQGNNPFEFEVRRATELKNN